MQVQSPDFSGTKTAYWCAERTGYYDSDAIAAITTNGTTFMCWHSDGDHWSSGVRVCAALLQRSHTTMQVHVNKDCDSETVVC